MNADMPFELSVLQANLIKRGFAAHVCPDKPSAAALLLELAADAGSVGIGNSITLRELGLAASLPGKAVYEHAPGCDPQVDRDALAADIYFTSANAISYDGQIVNIDGNGNRTAATCYGPRKVVFVVGRNKIAADLPAALDRAQTAAMRHARHYEKPYACATEGVCNDCLAPDCICGVTAVHRKQFFGNEIAVVLGNADMGK